MITDMGICRTGVAGGELAARDDGVTDNGCTELARLAGRTDSVAAPVLILERLERRRFAIEVLVGEDDSFVDLPKLPSGSSFYISQIHEMDPIKH